jgi:hypothetical protein
VPQVLLAAFGCAVLWFAYRWFRREQERVDMALKRAQRRIRRKNLKDTALTVSLRLDPATGYYTPGD